MRSGRVLRERPPRVKPSAGWAVSGKGRLRLFLDQLAFEELTHLLEQLQPLFLGEVHALVGQVGFGQLAHLLLDLF